MVDVQRWFSVACPCLGWEIREAESDSLPLGDQQGSSYSSMALPELHSGSLGENSGLLLIHGPQEKKEGGKEGRREREREKEMRRRRRERRRESIWAGQGCETSPLQTPPKAFVLPGCVSCFAFTAGLLTGLPVQRKKVVFMQRLYPCSTKIVLGGYMLYK